MKGYSYLTLTRDGSIVRQLLTVFESEPSSAADGIVSSHEDFSSVGMLGPWLREADLTPTWLVRCLAAVTTAAALCSFTIDVVIGLAVGACGIATVVALLRRRAMARRMELERDLPALLSMIAASVRAGIDPLEAVTQAGSYFPKRSVLARELDSFRNAIESGAEEERAVNAFCGSLRHPDLPLFRACLCLARRHGSSLAEPLHRVTRVIRQRQSFRRKTRAALAMHRMSAVGIALCAVTIVTIQIITNAHGLKLAFDHPVGSKILCGGAALMVCGFLWMMSFGRSIERS